MSEQGGPEEVRGLEEEKGERVAEMLADPEVQAGLAAVRAKIAERHGRIGPDGKLEFRDEGVTDDGLCISVAQYGGEYSAFTYNLSDVTDPGFAENLEERRVGFRGRPTLEVERPGDPAPFESYEEYRDVLRLRTKDPAAYEPLKEKVEAYSAWRNRNRVSFKAYGEKNPAPARYGGSLLRTFEEAALGPQGRERVEREKLLLQGQEAAEMARMRTMRRVPTAEEEEAALKTMREQARATIKVMQDNPTMVRNGPDVVFDPAKAEQEAHEVHKPAKKGLFGRFRR